MRSTGHSTQRRLRRPPGTSLAWGRAALPVAAVLFLAGASANGQTLVLDLHTRSGIGVSTSEKIFGVRDDPVSFSAPGLIESSQFGVLLTSRLAVFLEVMTITLPPPEPLVVAGLPLLEESSPFGAMAGVGVGWFLGHPGAYVSVAAGVAGDELSVIGGQVSWTSDRGPGFGLSARADRTWRLGEHTSVTLAAQFLWMANPEREAPERVHSTWGLGVLLSLDYLWAT